MSPLYTYTFFADGRDIEQDDFPNAKEALAHAKKLEEKIGKKVKTAYWIRQELDEVDREKVLLDWLREQQYVAETLPDISYATGLWNGLELAISGLVGRKEAVLKDVPLVKPVSLRVRAMTDAEKEAYKWSKEKVMGQINDLLNLQHDNVHDPYSAGMYNGIEVIAATLEHREPEFLDCPTVPILDQLHFVLSKARREKPDEPGERARYHAIFITELEKLFAYYSTWLAEKPVKPLEELINSNVVDKATFHRAWAFDPKDGVTVTRSEEKPQFKYELKQGAPVVYVASNGVKHPALISRVKLDNDEQRANLVCNILSLQIDLENVKDLVAPKNIETWIFSNVRYSEKNEPQTWHWPE